MASRTSDRSRCATRSLHGWKCLPTCCRIREIGRPPARPVDESGQRQWPQTVVDARMENSNRGRTQAKRETSPERRCSARGKKDERRAAAPQQTAANRMAVIENRRPPRASTATWAAAITTQPADHLGRRGRSSHLRLVQGWPFFRTDGEPQPRPQQRSAREPAVAGQPAVNGRQTCDRRSDGNHRAVEGH